MRNLVFLPFFAGLAACGSPESEQPQNTQAESAPATETTRTLPTPRREEFAAAWAEACTDAEPVGKALCKSKGITDPNFTCDFALGDGEYRRHTAEIMPGEEEWELADPVNACAIG